MTENLREYVNSHATPLRIDGRRGVIRGVKILGVRSRNGRRYEQDALRRAASLYENAKVNVNHARSESETPRDYQDRIGVVRNVQFQDEGLFADFHFNPKHALAEQLLWDAEHASENVGFSHDVRAKIARDGEETVVKSIVSVQSVDLVADPATTQGLFEEIDNDELALNANKGDSASEDVAPVVADPAESQDASDLTSTSFWESLTLEQLQDQRSDLVEAIQSESDATWNLRLEEQTASLRETVLEMEQRETETHRRETAVRLLREQGLEAPREDRSKDPERVQRVGSRFFEMLTGLTDEQHMRELIEEHASVLCGKAKRSVSGLHEGRPRSREQNLASKQNDISPLKTFVQSVVR
jgi:hypothetical protein